MEYRVLGRTGLKVSEIGFGCGSVGGLMIRGKHEEQVEAVRLALSLGINYFDTAPSYGNGQSEVNLGKVLHELEPKDVVVATKLELRSEDLGNVTGAVRTSLRESLSRLRRDSVDVLLLHPQVAIARGGVRAGALGVDDLLGASGVADAFDEARSKGLIRFCGFTGIGETEALHRVIASGRFDLVQAYYNLLNPSAGVVVPPGFVGHDFKLLIRRAYEKRMGVAAIRVLAGGALGGEAARKGYASSAPSALVGDTDYRMDSDRAERLQFLMSGGMSLPQAAIRFALMNKEVSTVLVGFSDVHQIEEAASCSGREPFQKEWNDKLQGLWATDFGRR
jgi:L-galactose dehydrogenase/L-glyceraldehyde 3-phosphate reductase